MNKSDKKSSKINFLYYFFAANIIFALLFYIFLIFAIDRNDENLSESIENGWTVMVNGNIIKDQPEGSIKSYIFPKLKKGDTFTLEKKLQKMDFLKPRIVFDTWNMITHVYIDNKPIYQNGVKYIWKKSMMGGRRHRIALPDNYAGKTLKIELFAIKNNPMPSTNIGIYDSRDSNLFWFERPFPLIVIGSMIVYIGVIAAILGYKYSKNSVLLGAFFFELGTYIICRSKTIDIVISNPDIYNKVEYLSLFLLPFTISLYIYKYMMEIKSKNIKIFYIAYLLEMYVFISLSFTLDLLNRINLSDTLGIYFLNVVMLGILLYVFFKNFKDKKDSPWIKYYKAAAVFFISGSFISIIMYILRSDKSANRFFHLWKWYDYIIPVFMIGTVVFILMGMYVFIEHLNYVNTKKEFYEYLAHIDGLTQLRNRRSFDDEFMTVEQKKDYAFTVFDLNFLKQTNDTLGHMSGDIMIKAFANILKDSVCPSSYVYRMGGDEFLILSYDLRYLGEILDKIREKTDSFNKQNSKIKISYAHGVARKGEAHTKEEILNLADTRMYEDKAKIKEKRKPKFPKTMC